ncbi:MAG TPA: LysR family transcriptional regulator [Sphingopyxis sp.]|nr:LysR family transcriptional regulator [Sphingopyxis sp.]
MDLRQLRYFITLAETLNFHRAAERLNMSQPPLTVAIRKLEESLGVRLFERGARGVRLTDAGLAALRPARAALEQAQLVREAAKSSQLGEAGTLRVGFVGSAIIDALPRIIPAFRARYPKVDLRLEERTSASIALALAERQIDIGFVRMPLMQPGDLHFDLVERDALVVALRHDHRLAARTHVALSELEAEPLIQHSKVSVLRSVVMLACQQAGFSPRIAQDATQVQTILSLVQSGLGIALVPARMVRIAPADIRLLALAEPPRIEMALASRPDSDAIARNFLSVALEHRDIGADSE